MRSPMINFGPVRSVPGFSEGQQKISTGKPYKCANGFVQKPLKDYVTNLIDI